MEDRKRSRGYPGSDLESSVEHLRQHVEANGFSPVSREDISRALGSAAVTGGTARKIGAMVSFGLLDRGEQGYSVTALGKKILRPLPGEEVGLRREALHKASLYQEILDRFKDDKRLPSALGTILERFHGIMPPNGDYAAKVFIDSARYAGVVDDTGNFTDSPTESSGPDQDNQANASRTSETEVSERPSPNYEHTNPERAGAFRFELPVSGALISVIIPEEASIEHLDLLLNLITALKVSRQ